MSIYNTPTLMHPEVEALLKNDAIDVSDLGDLPTVLFPPLFIEAFRCRNTKLLKAMVVSCPFPYLTVGPLLKTASVEMMETVLDCIDILLTQKAHSRRGKLQVLDLRVEDQDFWDVCTRREDGSCSADTWSKKHAPKSLPTCAPRQHFQVVTNLNLCFYLNKYQKCLLQWAQKRKDVLQLCCLKMSIFALPQEIIREVLNIVQLNYIEELEIHTQEVPSFLDFFAHFLGQMRNLLKFDLNQIDFNENVVDTVTDVKKFAAKFFSQFSQLRHLQHVYMNGAHFANDNMQEFFRCLKSPLESLSITSCHLSKSDLKHMSECERLFQLKHLHFNDVVVSKSGFKSLQILLENVSGTLQTLQLEHCRMEDSELRVLLPAMSQCSQLTRINFYNNDFSSLAMKDLLPCIANLRKLTLEL